MYTHCSVTLTDALLLPGQKLIEVIPTTVINTGRIRDLKKPLVHFEWVDFKLDKRTFPCVQVSVQTSELEPAGGVFTRFEAGARLARGEQTRHSASTSPPPWPARGCGASLLPLTNSEEEVHSNNMNTAAGPLPPPPPCPALFTLFKLSYRRLTPQWDFD